MSLDLEARVKELEASLAKRDAVFVRLRDAFSDLESAAPLRELGQASSFVNHEIKNYMMVISGYSTLLMRSKTLSDKDRGMVSSIAQSATNLMEFSTNVHEAAKSGMRRGGDEIDLTETLVVRIGKDFADKADRVSVSCMDDRQSAILVNIEPEKLSRAVACALDNAFEAGAQKINVRTCVRNYIAMVIIDDDGAGCAAETFPKLSKTFFTTKYPAGGAAGSDGFDIGLGLCTLRSIVQSYGGNVSIYSKNLRGQGEHGLSVQIMIPASKRTLISSSTKEALLVRDGIGDPARILKMMKNLKVVPRTINEVRDIKPSESGASLKTVIIAAPDRIPELKVVTAGTSVQILTVEEDNDILFVTNIESGIRELFTEEYVAREICGV